MHILVEVGVIIVDEGDRTVKGIFFAASRILRDQQEDILVSESIRFELVVDFQCVGCLAVVVVPDGT